MSRVIDLTRELTDNTPVYPGDGGMHLRQIKFIEKDGYNDHRLEMGMHVGTHIDGPMHMTSSKTYISDINLQRLIGKGCMIAAEDMTVIEYKEEYESTIEDESIVIVCTGYSQHFGTKKYFEEHPVISEEFAKLLIRKEIKAICVDMPSPDKYPFNLHKLLLSNNIVIAENLTNLDMLKNCGEIEVFLIPLNIRADGSMVRVFARTI